MKTHREFVCCGTFLPVIVLVARLSIAAAILGGLSAAPALAAMVTYSDYVSDVSVTLGNTTYACTTTSDPNCAFVSFIATGDTSDVVPFSVVGASGFKNSNLSVSVDIFLNSGQSFTEMLMPGQLYVSVDQTNGGAGFGSTFGPTYPAATYGGSADYSTYDLTTDFYVQGFSGFCPDVALCNTGAPLATVSDGNLSLSYPFRPNFSIFSATVTPTEAPESSSMVLALSGFFLIAAYRAGTRPKNPRTITKSQDSQ